MLTLTDAVDAYLAQGQSEGWVAETIRSYHRYLDPLVVFLKRAGCRSPVDVTPADLDEYMQQLLDIGRAKKTRIGASCLIRCWFRWLQEQGRIVTNPAHALPQPDDGEAALPPIPLSEAEVSALFDALPRVTVIDLRNRCLLELLYGCALRCSEATGLNLHDVDIGQRTVHVRQGKGCQQRLLPLEGAALSATKDYLAVRRLLVHGPDNGAVFLTQYGTRLSTTSVRDWFQDLNKARGPDAPHLHAHLFRRSSAVHLLRAGVDVRAVQDYLGHARLDTTKIYLRLVDTRLTEDYRRTMPEIEVGITTAT